MQVANAGLRSAGRLSRANGAAPGKLSHLRWINLAAVSETRSRNRFALLEAQHRDVLAIGDLLRRALTIQVDLWYRLSERPKNRTLLQLEKHYGKLVEQLLWEHKTALTAYLVIIRRISKP